MSDLAMQMIFSPQNCTLELLRKTLTPRRREVADGILDRLEDACVIRAACHQLVVGPRGAGKTHVLSYVRKCLEQRCQDVSPLVLICLSEEERAIARLLDFVVACIRATDMPVDRAMKRVRSMPRARAADEAMAVLDEFLAGRGVVILVENFDRLLSGMDTNAVDELRAFFQARGHVSLLASATGLFEDSAKPDHPFYGFFLIHPLEPMDRKACREFLAVLAEAAGDVELAAMLRQPQAQARVNAVYDLTGGNHRLLAMLSSFLSVEGLGDLIGPFLQMVDRQLTPYYQQRLDRLNPQQNMVLRAIVDIPSTDASLGRAVGLAEIVDFTLLSSQHCSRLLYDLRYSGLIRTIRTGRESVYELNEPLLRLVLDMKQGRSGPLPLIVGLLKLWYEPDELKGLAQAAPAGIREYYLEAMGRVTPRVETSEQLALSDRQGAGGIEATAPHPTGYAACTEPEGGSEREALLAEGIRLGQGGRHEEALRRFEEILGCVDLSPSDAVLAMVNRGVALGFLGRSEDAIVVYDLVVERFGSREEVPLLEQVAKALATGAVCLFQLGKMEEACVRSARAAEMRPDDPVMLCTHVRVLLWADRRVEAISVLADGMAKIPAEGPGRSMVAAVVIEECCRTKDVLSKAIEVLKGDRDALAAGLVSWLRSLLPLSKADAEALEACESVLIKSLADVPQCQPILRMLRAIRGDAMGDRRALLDLPLELRRLVRPD